MTWHWCRTDGIKGATTQPSGGSVVGLVAEWRMRAVGIFPGWGRCFFLFPSVLWHYLLGDRKGIWPTRNLPLIDRGSRLEQTKEENMGDWLLQVHLEKRCWNGDGGWWLMWIGILISNPQFFMGDSTEIRQVAHWGRSKPQWSELRAVLSAFQVQRMTLFSFCHR